jgi:hypothetical protein
MPNISEKGPASKAAKGRGKGKAPVPAGKDKPQMDKEGRPVDPRPVIYPEVREMHYWAGADGPIDEALAIQFLGWETEKEYVERYVREHPDEKPDVAAAKAAKFIQAHALLRDEEGNLVYCSRNSRNRPFNEAWARGLAQDTLNRCWAGPTAMPDTTTFIYGGPEPYEMLDGTVLNPGDQVTLPETVNGEAKIIGRHGSVESGQHSFAAVVIATQMWRKDQAAGGHVWGSKWPTPPVIEATVTFGVSESQRVLRTQDNTLARTGADVLYTSDLFQGRPPVERRELAMYMNQAIDFLWKRTRPIRGRKESPQDFYLTNSQRLEFQDAHPRLAEACEHIFKVNAGHRAISVCKLRPGACAGVLYLMGYSHISDDDADAYRNALPPSEALLKPNKERWSKALAFWNAWKVQDNASEGTKGPLSGVKEALALVIDEGNGRETHKMAILARAWDNWLHQGSLEAQVLRLTEDDFVKDSGDNYVLKESFSFKGIDLGSQPGLRERVPQADVEAAKEAARAEAAARVQARVAEARAKKEEERAAKNGGPAKGGAAAPPAPAGKPSRKQTEAEQTRKAREADEALARERATQAVLDAEQAAAEEEEGPAPEDLAGDEGDSGEPPADDV